DKEHGRALLYGTTNTFLEHFGLRSTADLPPLEDFAPDEESRRFIRERLSGRSIAQSVEESADDIDEERELLSPSSDSYDLDEDWTVGSADEGSVDGA
ncbi:MAG: SMC-Scp complex subunit ScpB, partial [Atopobiaceae bacterium]|nr:SMC-Scp complex subunit ScpB [Atopobiaceae bacterium]